MILFFNTFWISSDDLAMGDQRSVDEHVERFTGQAIEFDDRALIQLQQVAYADLGRADLHRQGDRDVEYRLEIGGGLVADRAGFQVLERCGLDVVHRPALRLPGLHGGLLRHRRCPVVGRRVGAGLCH